MRCIVFGLLDSAKKKGKKQRKKNQNNAFHYKIYLTMQFVFPICDLETS
jgi:hypothetical protein